MILLEFSVTEQLHGH